MIVAFLKIGNFLGKRHGSSGLRDAEFYTLPNAFIRRHHKPTSSWQKVLLRGLEEEIATFKNEVGFEQIADRLGVRKPLRQPAAESSDD